MKTKALIPILVIIFWVVCFGFATSNFNHLTLESERKALIFEKKPQLWLEIIDDNDNASTMSKIAINQQKVVVAQFMYTSCRTLCSTLGNQFQQLQRHIIDKGLENKIHLASISFDVDRDSAHRLKKYRELMRADDKVWSLATLKTANDLKLAREQLGLIIVPSQSLDIVHNSAFLVIASDGRLVGIFNDDDMQGALALAVIQLQLEA